ncbi:MAG: hypothetical protein HRT42_01785 [Campylobacteraceae bacterium]|nr:hypothetical protein [Campylobacteraceae bacterium]
MKSFGKLSFKGSPHFEEKMTSLLNDISSDIENVIDLKSYTCVILIGGYGRGEGGVIKINNIEFPHNNLDFLIVSKNIGKTKKIQLKNNINSIITTHCKRVNIDFDLSIICEFTLKICEPLVITYDMKYGHKVINGDFSFFTRMKRFDIENIPNWDIRNLMVNRGTLLIINDLILAKKNRTIKDLKTIIKHCVKAIIGYGDALLYYYGDYHYSYVEKKIRMSKQNNVDDTFKKMYNDAMDFRFEPNYEKYLQLDLITFQNSVKDIVKQIHLTCESISLGKKDIKWKSYFETALSNSFLDTLNIKMILKNIPNLFLPNHFIKDLTLKNKLRAKILGKRGVLPLLFPYVAFGMQDKNIELLNSFFNIKTTDKTVLKQQYLLYWRKYINNNFSLKEYGL